MNSIKLVIAFFLFYSVQTWSFRNKHRHAEHGRRELATTGPVPLIMHNGRFAVSIRSTKLYTRLLLVNVRCARFALYQPGANDHWRRFHREFRVAIGRMPGPVVDATYGEWGYVSRGALHPLLDSSAAVLRVEHYHSNYPNVPVIRYIQTFH